MNDELKQEWKEEMRQEWKEENYHLEQMKTDEEYAVHHFESEIQNAYDKLCEVSNKLYEYGYTLDAKQLLDYVE